MPKDTGVKTIDFIIGMPPITTITGDSIHTQRSAEALKNTMPIATIYPGIPSFESGIDLFRRIPTFDSEGGHPDQPKMNTTYYLPMLRKHGYTLDKGIHNSGVKIAYIADNFPTDTFTNEYGENFLQKFTDVASEAAASISQMFGARDIGQLASGMIGAGKKTGGTVGKVAEMAGKANNYIKDLGGMFANYSPAGARMAGMVSSLASGSRIDFPMVWKSSSFAPSYSMTVRLYNPNPGDVGSTQKYIIGPIAAIMLLGIPISQDSSTYSWPYLHRVESKGIYSLDPAYIQNITVIKGGDQQQIAYNQSLAMVDVRIDFGSLFSSMLASTEQSNKTRPTLRKYLAAMESEEAIYNITGGKLLDPQPQKPLNTQVKGSGRNLQAFTKSRAILDASSPEEPPDRVTQAVKDIGNEILSQIPKGFRVGPTF
ncbi:MAG: hypothetical protein KGD64_07795 [Candidatus Heimdallarchaeota archaeon]|nr:hypothetical protein [Candidatus Heimdallarchaeota archaeon]